MNTLKITKSSDVKILVDDELLCFVMDFSAKENRDAYEIEEILADECVDVVNNKKDYTIVITAYSMLDGSVFEKSPFTLKAVCDSSVFEYYGCALVSFQRDINSSKPLTDRYVIRAKGMRVKENE